MKFRVKACLMLLFHRLSGPPLITIIYFIFGFLWILLTDKILLYLSPDNSEYVKFQTYKGWLYIVITTVLVYVLSRIYAVHKEKALSLSRENERITSENLKEKESLLKEIHHRVKNNLQIIISLLRMKGKVLDDEIFSDKIQDVIDKIKAIALVHEKLYETESLSDVDFKSYILDIVRHLLISHSATNSLKTEFDVDDIIMPIEKAVPCGILINEIITIILKYVFPAPKEGFIHISLKKTESDRCLLLIEDNGDKTDLNDRHPDHLFGMQLIHILSEQLKGDLEIHSSTSGTKYSLLLDI